MRKITFIILIGFAIWSCSNEDDEPNNNIIGKWNWKMSYGGFDGLIETPESSGHNRILEITSDSLKMYLNSQLSYNTKYIIENRESELYNELREMIIWEKGTRQIIEFKGGKLILTFDQYEGYTSEYTRVD